MPVQEIVFRATNTTDGTPFPFIPSGTIVILFQRGEAAVVRYEEPTGRVDFPTFTHPKNVIALLPQTMEAVQAFYPDIKLSKRSRIFTCPAELAVQADWSGFDPEWVSSFHRGQKATVPPLYFRGSMNPQGQYSPGIFEDAEKLNVCMNLLPAERAIEIRYEVEDRFADGTEGVSLCERLREPYEALRWDFQQEIDISALVGDESVLFFLEYWESPGEVFNVFELAEGAKAMAIVQQSRHYTCYITNKNLDYLFAYWQEDVIFVAGSAISWFKKAFLESS